MKNKDSTQSKGQLVTSRRKVMQATGGLGLAGFINAIDPVKGEKIADDSNIDWIKVLCLGGPAGGSHNGPARAIQIVPYLLDRGIEVEYTDRQSDLEEDTLHRYDALMMYDNHSGLTQDQEDSLIDFVNNGGGFVALHSASGSFTGSDRFIDLIGGQFLRHNTGEMTTNHVKPNHPVLSNLDPIQSWDETYRHQNLNPDNIVLAYGEFPDYGPNEDPEPWTWVRNEGDGRVFYTAWGHGPEPWSKDGFKRLVENAIRWTTDNEDTIAEDTRALDTLDFIEPPDEIPYFGPADEVPSEVGEGTNWELMQEGLSPTESMKRTITPEGFELEPYVTEDMFPDGIEGNILDVEFDARGRAWIAITKDYPNDLGEGRDKILICEDSDGDGKADKFTVFADGLSIPLNMVLTEEGVITVNLGEFDDNGSIVHLKDTTGDGTADEWDELFSGFGTGDTHASANQLEWGIDNWIWGQVGYSGFSGTIDDKETSFNTCVFRFKPDGSALEVVASLPGNQAGLGFNEEGLAFASAATTEQPSNYISIPQRYYEMVNGFSASTLDAISDSNRILPMTDRYRQGDRFRGFTAAAGHEIYTARKYPKKYWNQAGFVSEPTGHLLGTFYLKPDGANYTAHYPHNLAASQDSWFSPIYSNVGPDGMLWFIDWYNYVILHNTLGDQEHGRGNAYINNMRDISHCRLYRVTYGDDTDLPQRDLSSATPETLVETLTDDNMFWRDTAQRMLVEREDTDIVSDLIDLIEDSSTDELGLNPGAIHSLWTLHGLGVLFEDGNENALLAARDALSHPSSGVRLNALRVLPETKATRDQIVESDVLNDENARVQMWALLALAGCPQSDAVGEVIYETIRKEENYSDELLVDAATSAGAQHADGFLTAYEENEDTSDDDDKPNLLTNPSFEKSTASVMPGEWTTKKWSGSASFSATETSRTGTYSARISSPEGVDGSWQHTVSVEPNTEYTYTAWLKTENLQLKDSSAEGAFINIGELAEDTVSNTVTEGTNDWTKVEIDFNSGDHEQLTLNATLGGWGLATGTVWFDDISLKGSDGTNLVSNSSFEDVTGDSEPDAPESWDTTTYQGDGEYSYATIGKTGDSSVKIVSSGGIDGSWSQEVSVEPNATYEFTAWVKTEDLQSGDSYGAIINPHQMGQSVVSNAPDDGTNDWTKLSTIFTTGNDQQSVQLNLTMGGWGFATGTVWFDDTKLIKTIGSGKGLETVYQRVKQHKELEDDDDNDDNGDDSGPIDPTSTIQFDAKTSGWVGTEPDSINEDTNPTLLLVSGETYTIKWTNGDGAPHDFYILDSEGNEIEGTELVLEQGESATIEFTATEEIAGYYCSVHPTSMRGSVEFESDGGDQQPPAIVGDSRPTDPDGDGHYEDINGDGDVNYKDVVDLFGHFEDDAVQNNPDAFDFNDNGQLDFDDIIELFNSI
ncbi:PVC-type heme-binding CxxCH protein [Haladaptatus sp. DYF46]|uniref:PVC-type heme-binding CxxCH protein n=1 Tax=Haladaptatus sp. DYF46 TaxID=2886041 RepID=UPI001E35AD3A|nr:PVC-type heme-binding CxxCH protein [Haladaptatus sp. DYF46]